MSLSHKLKVIIVKALTNVPNIKYQAIVQQTGPAAAQEKLPKVAAFFVLPGHRIRSFARSAFSVCGLRAPDHPP